MTLESGKDHIQNVLNVVHTHDTNTNPLYIIAQLEKALKELET